MTRRQRSQAPAPRSWAASSSPGRDRLEPGVQDEHRVRQEDVHERDCHGEAVEDQEAERVVDQTDALECAVDHAVLAQHRAPGIDAHEVAREHRGGDQEQHDHARASRRVAQPVGDGKGEPDREHGREQADLDGVPRERAVQLRVERGGVRVERERARDVVQLRGQEAVGDEDRNGRDEEDQHARGRGQRQQYGPQLEPARLRRGSRLATCRAQASSARVREPGCARVRPRP